MHNIEMENLPALPNHLLSFNNNLLFLQTKCSVCLFVPQVSYQLSSVMDLFSTSLSVAGVLLPLMTVSLMVSI